MLEHWLPDGKQVGNEYQALNPTRPDNELGSFTINLVTGVWADFADTAPNAKGDLVSLVAYLEKCELAAAARRLEAFLDGQATAAPSISPVENGKIVKALEHRSDGWHPIVPVPDCAPTLPTKFYVEGGNNEPSLIWTYRTSTAKVACHVLRFDLPNGNKTYSPATYCRNEDGRQGWRQKGLVGERPLYQLDRIASHVTAPILICEGEKAADAAQSIFPYYVCTTSLNGSKSPSKTDWKPIANRKVYIWPDYDEAGQAYAEAVVDILRGINPSVEIFVLGKITHQPKPNDAGTLTKAGDFEPTRGCDAADAVELGWTTEYISMLGNSLFIRVPKGDEDLGIPAGFVLNKDGVYHQKSTKDGDVVPIRVCAPLRITALTRDSNDENWGRLLEFKDPDGNHHRRAIPMTMFSGRGDEYRSILLGDGLNIVSSAGSYLHDYISSAAPRQRALCVEQVGWNDGVFILPDATYGKSQELVVYQNAESDTKVFSQKGSLEEWKTSVSALCAGNSRLAFSISLAFAVPLLPLLEEESGGFHFTGASSIGKTKTLQVASSVWGGKNYLQRWRATSNGLEAVAKTYNNVLLPLDEIAQVSSQEAGEIAYMLANGQGKQRATRTGGSKSRSSWQLLFLSAGEVGLAEHMRQSGKKVRARQEIRLADIPADAEAGLGIFENLHGESNGAKFAHRLTEATARFYGTAGRAFVEWVAARPDQAVFIDDIKRRIAVFMTQHVAGSADGQIQRVGQRFALVAIAGELAIEAGLVVWPQGEALNAAKKCLEA